MSVSLSLSINKSPQALLDFWPRALSLSLSSGRAAYELLVGVLQQTV
jgi:hypothetical protein